MDLSSLATMEHMYHIQRNTFFWQHAGILVPSESESHSVVSNSLWPHSPGQNTGMGSLSLLQGNLPNPGIKPWSPTLQAESLPAEPPGKPLVPRPGTKPGALAVKAPSPTQEAARDSAGGTCGPGKRLILTSILESSLTELKANIVLLHSINLINTYWPYTTGQARTLGIKQGTSPCPLGT